MRRIDMTFLDDIMERFINKFLEYCKENDIELCNKITRRQQKEWVPLSDIPRRGAAATKEVIDLFIKEGLK